MTKLTRGFIVVAVGLALWFAPLPTGLKPQALHLFAIFAAVIIGFILQPIPTGAIALVGLSITSATGVLKLGEVLSGFSNGTIWLIVSAFLFAKGFIKTGLGRRISYLIMQAIGDSTLKMGYAFVLSDIIMAPATPSSTARVGGVLFPIARSLSSAFGSEPGPTARRMGSYLILLLYEVDAIACAMFLTAMAGNPLIALLAKETLKIEISWGLWATAAIVPGIVSLLLIPYVLYKIYPPEITKTPEAKEMASQELAKMGPMKRAEKIMCGVFIGALTLWVTAQYNNLDATVVALLGVSVMLTTGVIEWKDVTSESGAWDTMVWMGTLIALAGSLSKVGFIPWFAKAVSASIVGISWMPAFLILLVVYVYSHYGFASLVAHITAMYAAFCAVAVAAGAPPYLVALALAFMSNLCMPLTHYGGGPAPLLFGAGYVDQATWWKLGFVFTGLNLIVWVGLGGIWWKILGLW